MAVPELSGVGVGVGVAPALESPVLALSAPSAASLGTERAGEAPGTSSADTLPPPHPPQKTSMTITPARTHRRTCSRQDDPNTDMQRVVR